jgi:MYXO-CTERM domain-containing protein
MRRAFMIIALIACTRGVAGATPIVLDDSTPWTSPFPDYCPLCSHVVIGDYDVWSTGLYFYKNGLATFWAYDGGGVRITRVDGLPFTPVAATVSPSDPSGTALFSTGFASGAAKLRVPYMSPAVTFDGPEWSDISSLYLGFDDLNAAVRRDAYIAFRSLTVADAAHPVPAPAPLALLGLAGGVAWRRRVAAQSKARRGSS